MNKKILITMLLSVSSVNIIAQTTKEKAKANPPKFEASWESLKQYECPEWFRDAKFGIWAHWGPQCEPEAGDWYARNMYIQGSAQYDIHNKMYGHPSKFGFKDVINLWKAENFNPDSLMKLYKDAGAKYFVALAAHHDNFDLWDSKYQPWNAVNIGPKQNLIKKWSEAAKNAGLHFGVSIHARSAWTWYEVAQMSDKTGPLAGVPYDGNLTKKDGKGLWWDGYDPQDLYAQNHRPSSTPDNRKIQSQNPGEPATKAYNEKFINRVKDVVEKYKPDLVYFDDYKLPLGMKDEREKLSLNLVADIYNSSIARYGKNETIINTKSLVGWEQKCLVNDLEVGTEKDINPIPWQSDACIGAWHYKKNIKYKNAASVINGLIDVVSKNGNLLLSIPIKGDGTIDDQEKNILKGIGQWMKINSEAIYGTRPWNTYGEGPSLLEKTPDNSKGNKPLFVKGAYQPEDFRFTTKGKLLYAFGMAWPTTGKIIIKSLASNGKNGTVKHVSMLGSQNAVLFKQSLDGLELTLPLKPTVTPYVLQIEGLAINVLANN